MMDGDSFVKLICIKEGSKLRVKIASKGYLNDANCQFPRDIREIGRCYKVKARNIKLVSSRGKYFYSINRRDVQIACEEDFLGNEPFNEDTPEDFKNLTVYEDEGMQDCCVCLSHVKEIVFNCGHFYTCTDCSKSLKICPICRSNITLRIPKEQIG
jgi:hypothetical protein